MQADRIGGNDRPREVGYFRLPVGGSSGLLSKWHDSLFGEFLRASGEMLAGKAGASGARAVFLCGSFSGGDGSVYEEGGRVVILSDIDLVMVVDSRGVHDALLERKAELGTECERLAPGVDFKGHVDVGVLVPGSLKALGRSPGVHGMISHPVTLWGDKDITGIIPPFGPSDIPRAEGVLLLENRIAPHLGILKGLGSIDEAKAPEFLYQQARVYTDIVTAVLCVAGLYESGYEERMTALERNIGDPLVSWLTGGEETSGKARSWTEFKLRPDPGRLMDPGRSPEEIWRESAADLLGAWRRCEAFIQGAGPGGGPVPRASRLIGSRKRRPHLLDNMRGWKDYLLSRDLLSRIAILSGRAADISFADPISVVRGEGVILLEKMVEDGPDAPVKAPRGRFPHGGGRCAEAARELSETWKELVSGRRE